MVSNLRNLSPGKVSASILEVRMRILVTFAVAAEFAPWRERHDFRSTGTSTNGTVYTAKISGADVFVGITGIGPKAAASKICGFTWCQELDLCISSGFAGALQSKYRVGDVLASREIIVDPDRSTTFEGKLLSSERLLQIAESSGAIIVERFYSSSSTVRTTEEKKALSHLAEAVEMESFEVLAEALAWMREGIAIRAISDSADEDLPLDFNAVVTEDGQLSVARLAGEIIRKPTAIPGLVRLGRRSSEAARRLADFLDSYISVLATKSELTSSGGSLAR
jgi:adenosylhomocysteine nucleosidase